MESKAENTQIWNSFMLFDHNKIGHIACHDLKPALEHLGEKISQSQAFRSIKELDPDNTGPEAVYTGHISFENFK